MPRVKEPVFLLAAAVAVALLPSKPVCSSTLCQVGQHLRLDPYTLLALNAGKILIPSQIVIDIAPQYALARFRVTSTAIDVKRMKIADRGILGRHRCTEIPTPWEMGSEESACQPFGSYFVTKPVRDFAE